MAWFKNFYICPQCRTAWDSEWSCGCDDECPGCSCESITPVESLDLTVIVDRNKSGAWDILRSQPEAGEHADYRLVGTLIPDEDGALRFFPVQP